MESSGNSEALGRDLQGVHENVLQEDFRLQVPLGLMGGPGARSSKQGPDELSHSEVTTRRDTVNDTDPAGPYIPKP